jgi:hypothetical protein
MSTILVSVTIVTEKTFTIDADELAALAPAHRPLTSRDLRSLAINRARKPIADADEEERVTVDFDFDGDELDADPVDLLVQDAQRLADARL